MKPNLLMLYFDGFPIYRTKLYGGLIATPNIEMLVSKSTFYSNVISTSASTAMTLTSMFTGLFPHEFGRRNYTGVGDLPSGTTSMFDDLEKMGYSTHVIWDQIMEQEQQKSRINVWQGKTTKFFVNFNRFTNMHLRSVVDKKILKRHGITWELNQALSYVKKINSPWAVMVRFGHEVSPQFTGASKGITNNKWDDEIFEIDNGVKSLLERFPENTRLILSSDHGRMYGEQGIWGYAFNLCEGTLKVPVIDYDPQKQGGEVVDKLLSLTDYKNIILRQNLKKTKYLYADTAYADQWHRKTMVRRDDWKYIYHRDGWPCREQFFDLKSDPHEMINLAASEYIDPYRDSRPKGDTADSSKSPSAADIHGKPLHQVIKRHDWNEVLGILEELREERKKIWAAQDVHELEVVTK